MRYSQGWGYSVQECSQLESDDDRGRAWSRAAELAIPYAK